MADREQDSNPKKEKDRENTIRDLPAKKDVKGGNAGEKQSERRRTGEIDFMQFLDQ